MNAFEKVMHEMKVVNEKTFKNLIKIPPRVWSKSRFKTNNLCDILVNNTSEAFNYVFFIAMAKTKTGL